MNVTVTLQNTDTPDALYRHYQGQSERQPCFLALDLEGGELWGDYNGEIGNGVPASVWHGLTLRWDMSCLTAEAANALLAEAAPIAQRVLDGSSIEWNGSNNVGRCNEDAQAAAEELHELAASYNEPGLCVVEWDVHGFFFDDADAIGYGITATSSDADLEALAERARADATACDPSVGYIVLNGVQEYFEALRDGLAEED